MADNTTAMTAIMLDRYVIETLMPDLVGHDHHPSAFLVYLALAAAQPNLPLSHAQLAERTGLSKRAVQDAVARLRRRELIGVTQGGPTEPARYQVRTPWRSK